MGSRQVPENQEVKGENKDFYLVHGLTTQI